LYQILVQQLGVAESVGAQRFLRVHGQKSFVEGTALERAFVVPVILFLGV
jgi:hypothetical protein